MVDNVRIGLCLSGGGARGIAHIGVLKALLEHNIQPDALSGASAGAIAGALFAAGLPIDKMMEFVKDSKILKMIKLGMPSGGLVKLTYVKERLSVYIETDNFQALKIPLFVAVTNLNTGKLEIISEGPLFDVVMASSSIPVVFQSVELQGAQYVDGGLLSNLPVQPLAPITDFIIGVNVMPHIEVEDKEIQSVIGIATRSFSLSILANTEPSIPLCDILIEPKKVKEYHLFQINKFEELIDIGYEATLEKMEEIKSGIEQLKVTSI